MGNKNKKVLLYRNLNSPATARSRSLPSARQQKAVVRQRPVKKWLMMGLCFLLLIGGVKVHYSNKAHAEALAAAAERARITAIKQTAFKQSVQTVINEHQDTTIGVVAVDLEDGSTTSLGSTRPFEAASTAKLLSAVAYLRLVEQGKLSLTPKNQADLRKMVELSDNDSWQRINDAITHARLRSFATNIGMTSYDPSTNYMSATDMALLVKKLYRGDILTEPHRELVLQFMETANYRDEIISNVPAGYETYHKIGFTDGNIHDVAIVKKGSQTMALLIYTNGNGTYNTTKRQDIFKPIVDAALKAYF